MIQNREAALSVGNKEITREMSTSAQQSSFKPADTALPFLEVPLQYRGPLLSAVLSLQILTRSLAESSG